MIISGSLHSETLAHKSTSQWLPFDENAIPADVQEGKTVFVDITADWCFLTRKPNR